MTEVWERSRHSGTELLMLLALADYSDDQGNSYPAVATLAARCRMKPRNANYILKELQDSRELEVRPNEGPKGTNRYRIVLSALGKGVQCTAGEGVQRSAPLQSFAPLQSSAPSPAMQCRLPLQPIADKPSLNRQEPSSSARRTRSNKRKARHAEHPLFPTFYTAYPRKAARQRAATAFAEANPDAKLLEAMLAAIKRQRLAERCQAGEEQYVPHPATWLREERWLDDDTPDSEGSAAAPAWLAATGFTNIYEAESAGCGPSNASRFRDGRRIA